MQSNNSAVLTLRIDPNLKKEIEEYCREIETTPSQLVRLLLKSYMDNRRGDGRKN